MLKDCFKVTRFLFTIQTFFRSFGSSPSPSVLQLKHGSGRWNQSALHRSPMPEGREKACLCRGCDPSSTTGIQPTDRMLFKMTECCGSDRLHPASRQCFRPTTVSVLVHLLSYVSLSEVGMLGMYRCLASRRQTPCNCHAKKIEFPHKHSCVCVCAGYLMPFTPRFNRQHEQYTLEPDFSSQLEMKNVALSLDRNVSCQKCTAEPRVSVNYCIGARYGATL